MCEAPQTGWLTVDQLVEIWGRPRRTVQWTMARWRRDGFPRIKRVTRECGGFSFVVHAEDFDRYRAGDLPDSTQAQASVCA